MSLNHVRPWRNIYRRKSRQIHVGNVPVGGDAPITVQTMTNTATTDVKATIEQIQRAVDAGVDIVRVSTPDAASTAALKEIVRESPVPIVADIHFHYKRAIEAAEAGAACLRINPGNIGSAERFSEVGMAARLPIPSIVRTRNGNHGRTEPGWFICCPSCNTQTPRLRHVAGDRREVGK